MSILKKHIFFINVSKQWIKGRTCSLNVITQVKNISLYPYTILILNHTAKLSQGTYRSETCPCVFK